MILANITLNGNKYFNLTITLLALDIDKARFRRYAALPTIAAQD